MPPALHSVVCHLGCEEVGRRAATPRQPTRPWHSRARPGQRMGFGSMHTERRPSPLLPGHCPPDQGAGADWPPSAPAPRSPPRCSPRLAAPRRSDAHEAVGRDEHGRQYITTTALAAPVVVCTFFSPSQPHCCWSAIPLVRSHPSVHLLIHLAALESFLLINGSTSDAAHTRLMRIAAPAGQGFCASNALCLTALLLSQSILAVLSRPLSLEELVRTPQWHEAQPCSVTLMFLPFVQRAYDQEKENKAARLHDVSLPLGFPQRSTHAHHTGSLPVHG